MCLAQFTYLNDREMEEPAALLRCYSQGRREGVRGRHSGKWWGAASRRDPKPGPGNPFRGNRNGPDWEHVFIKAKGLTSLILEVAPERESDSGRSDSEADESYTGDARRIQRFWTGICHFLIHMLNHWHNFSSVNSFLRYSNIKQLLSRIQYTYT